MFWDVKKDVTLFINLNLKLPTISFQANLEELSGQNFGMAKDAAALALREEPERSEKKNLNLCQWHDSVSWCILFFLSKVLDYIIIQDFWDIE